MFITRGDKRKAVINSNFGGGQRKSEICLREGGHGGTESISKLLCSVKVDGNREESGFVVVVG